MKLARMVNPQVPESFDTPDEMLRGLREALRATPNNLALRQHLADTLLGFGRAEEAEREYREALALGPNSVSLKLGLARAFHRQGKTSHALVVIEELVKLAEPAPRALILHARLLASSGEIEQAVAQYRRGVERDASVADLELAQRLGIRADAGEERGAVVEGRVRTAWEEGGPAGDREVERPKLTFAGVGGMESVKEEIRIKIIHPLTHAELFRAYGKPVGGGILMYGPPGCGKTHLARATAGEIRAAFLAVGINDVLEMWIGNSERNLHELFEQARNNRPCVLFFDEVDALGASRSDMRQSGGRHLINQFLAELDGVKTSNEGVLILAATNAPWHLDAAFRRPGRFDRILFVPPPDEVARADILRIHLRGKPCEDIEFEQLAKKTEHFSGADLKAVIDVAIERKLREALQAGVPRPLTTRDLLSALSTRKPTTREWFATAKNYALYSNQGGLYDEILDYLRLR